jgi:hypothetical protein
LRGTAPGEETPGEETPREEMIDAPGMFSSLVRSAPQAMT